MSENNEKAFIPNVLLDEIGNAIEHLNMIRHLIIERDGKVWTDDEDGTSADVYAGITTLLMLLGNIAHLALSQSYLERRGLDTNGEPALPEVVEFPFC